MNVSAYTEKTYRKFEDALPCYAARIFEPITDAPPRTAAHAAPA